MSKKQFIKENSPSYIKRVQNLTRLINQNGFEKAIQNKDLTIEDYALLDLITRKSSPKMKNIRKRIEPFLISKRKKKHKFIIKIDDLEKGGEE
jgi:hypothetical protein